MATGAKAQYQAGGLEIRLFGPCEVRVGGQPLPPLRYRKDLWLLALLTLRTGRDTLREHLAVTLWPDAEASQGLYYLRRSLSNLRRALGDEAARLRSPTSLTLHLDLDGGFADVAAFDAALGRDAWDTARLTNIPEERLAGAVAVYRGPLLADCTDDWAIPERTSREQAYLAALEALAARLAARGAFADATRPLRLLLAADPYRESAHAALMQALADSGDRAAVRVVYQALRRTLRSDLAADPAPVTQELYRRLLARRASPAPSPSDAAPDAAPQTPSSAPVDRTGGRHLPVPLTDLIGREGAVAEIVGWLGRCRLVTLLGPGGVGKTRLSIAAAEAALARFPDGVWFVDLAALTDALQVPAAACRALGVAPVAGRPAGEALAEALADRALLLVLDNCEHLSDACAALADGLLSACPGLRVLATSRQPLGLPGEQSWDVPTLSAPPEAAARSMDTQATPETGEKDPAGLLDFAAVRLFVERARQADLSFRLTRRNAAAVADICRRLDGIPLALEMAAARSRSLSAPEILSRLEDRFRLLTGGRRSALPRQQTLRAAIDWSYDLLSHTERAALRRVSVFAGGWSVAAAGTICAGDDLTADGVPDVLARLVEKSLVGRTVPEDGATRFSLLETVREYAARRLDEAGETEDARRRHFAWCRALLEDAKRHWDGHETAFWMDRLEREHDNLRSALAWSIVSPDGMKAGLTMASELMWFWFQRGHLREGLGHLERALAHPDAQAPTIARANALMSAGVLAYEQNDLALARHCQEEGLAILRDIGSKSQIAGAMNNLANLLDTLGERDGARRLREDGLGIALGVAGEPDAARRRSGERVVAHLLCGLAESALTRGEWDQARTHYARTIDIAEKHDFTQILAMGLLGQGSVAAAQGNLMTAHGLHIRALAKYWGLGHQWGIGQALEALGTTLEAQGKAENAVRLWGAAETLRAAIGSPQKPPESAPFADRLARARAALGDAVFAAAWDEGGGTPLALTVGEALAGDG